jgi:hypothetical protein
MGLSFDYLTIFGGFATFFGIEYKFNYILCILYIYIYIYIYIKIKEDSYIIFPGIRPGAAFVVLLVCSPAVRPPLALVGDGHPDSHVTDANAG